MGHLGRSGTSGIMALANDRAQDRPKSQRREMFWGPTTLWGRNLALMSHLTLRWHFGSHPGVLSLSPQQRSVLATSSSR